jgi:hypothetical protein
MPLVAIKLSSLTYRLKICCHLQKFYTCDRDILTLLFFYGFMKPLVLLIGTKNDLASLRKVQTNEGVQLAAAYNVPFFELSVKDYSAVRQCLEFIIRELCLQSKQHVLMSILDGGDEQNEEPKLSQEKKRVIGGTLGDFSWAFNNRDFSDITFTFPTTNTEATKRLYAHRCILYSRAEAWRENLRTCWATNEVCITDVSYEIFYEILKFIYKYGSLRPIF